MIEKLKMRVAGIIFGKNLCLKSVTDTFFFKYVVCDKERDGVRHEGKSCCQFLKQTSNAGARNYIYLKF